MSLSHTLSTDLSNPFPTVQSSASRAIWTGRSLSGLAVAFLTMDTAMKLLRLQAAVEGTAQLGYRPDSLLTIGLIEVALLIIYLIPRSSILGAVLWTGYLGGAIATHVRVGNPLLTHILFPTYVAALLWVGLWLRDRRLRGVFVQA